MRFQDTSQKSNRKLSYVELKWFYALADPKDQHMFLLQLDDQTQRMFIIEQRIDQLEKKFDDFRKKQDSAKWYHANRFMGWFYHCKYIAGSC